MNHQIEQGQASNSNHIRTEQSGKFMPPSFIEFKRCLYIHNNQEKHHVFRLIQRSGQHLAGLPSCARDLSTSRLPTRPAAGRPAS